MTFKTHLYSKQNSDPEGINLHLFSLKHVWSSRTRCHQPSRQTGSSWTQKQQFWLWLHPPIPVTLGSDCLKTLSAILSSCKTGLASAHWVNNLNARCGSHIQSSSWGQLTYSSTHLIGIWFMLHKLKALGLTSPWFHGLTLVWMKPAMGRLWVSVFSYILWGSHTEKAVLTTYPACRAAIVWQSRNSYDFYQTRHHSCDGQMS